MMFATRMIYIHQAVLYTINPRALCERLLIVVCLFETHAQGAKFYSLLLFTDGFIVAPSLPADYVDSSSMQLSDPCRAP